MDETSTMHAVGPLYIGIGGKDVLGAGVHISDVQLAAGRNFLAYAAPSVWGPEVIVGSAAGSVTYAITYEPVGEALVMGRVRYFKGSGAGILTTEEFKDNILITTAEGSFANIACEFKGVPLGSTVTGTVKP